MQEFPLFDNCGVEHSDQNNNEPTEKRSDWGRQPSINKSGDNSETTVS